MPCDVFGVVFDDAHDPIVERDGEEDDPARMPKSKAEAQDEIYEHN